MDNKKSLATAIGEVLGRTAVGAVTLPFKFRKWQQETGVKVAKAGLKAGKQAGVGFRQGVGTPVRQQDLSTLMPYLDENLPSYLGRTAGMNIRRQGKLLSQIPGAVGRGLYNLGEQEVALAQGIGQGVAGSPEVASIRPALDSAWSQMAAVPRAVQQKMMALVPPRIPAPKQQNPPIEQQIGDALRQQIMMNLMGY